MRTLRRYRMLGVWLTNPEKQALEKAARRAGLSTARLVRAELRHILCPGAAAPDPPRSLPRIEN
jgi:hypothetical protein